MEELNGMEVVIPVLHFATGKLLIGCIMSAVLDVTNNGFKKSATGQKWAIACTQCTIVIIQRSILQVGD